MEEEELLVKERSSQKWREIGEEMKRLGYLAAPMVAITLSFDLLQIITLMMVGHLGELALSSTAIVVSLAGVTGFILLLNASNRLGRREYKLWSLKHIITCSVRYGLCSRDYKRTSFWTQQYEKIGTQTYTAIFSLIIVCIPLSILWIYVENLLRFVGQDPQISHEAGKMVIWLIPALFAYAMLQPLIRYYQMQSLISPMLISSCVTLCFHVPVCWVLVFKLGLKNVGGAIAMDLSMWLNVISLSLYMKYSPHCIKTRALISMKIFDGMKEFFSFAVPSAIMICLEWWSFELLILLSGLLPNPQLETSGLSVCFNTVTTLASIPYGLAAAGSIRISNEVGGSRAEGARLSMIALILLAAMNALVVSLVIFGGRNVLGYIFSNEKEVVDYVTDMAPLVCLSIIVECIQGVLSGVARGCGWQNFGAYINLAAFYLFGIPLAAALGFWLNLRGKGLWIGLLCGATLQTLMLSVITALTNWEEQAAMARERLLHEDSADDDRLT